MELTDALRLAGKHYEAGRIDDAARLCRELLHAGVYQSEALHMLGRIEQQAGRHDKAIELISMALAHDVRLPGAHNHLGDAYTALGNLKSALQSYEAALALDSNDAEAQNGLGIVNAIEGYLEAAVRCFKSALSLRPDWAVAHYNLGLALKRLHLLAPASQEFRAAWLLNPRLSNAIIEMVNAVAEVARAAPRCSQIESIEPARAGSPSFSIIFCSIDEVKYARTNALYRRLFSDFRHEIIPIRDAKSLAEAYNRGVELSTGDIVLISHDDVDILAPDFAMRLLGHLATYDALGVIGATEMSGPAWTWSQHPHLRGWITHHARQEEAWHAAVVDPRPVAGDVVVLDGVLIAGHRAVFDEISFDAETFDGFHLYDLDWSWRAAQAGYRLAAAGDLLLVHASRGNFDATWSRYAAHFCLKFGLKNISPPPPPQLISTSLSDADQVRAFFQHLSCIAEGNLP